MSTDTALSRAVLAVSSTGSGGQEHAGEQCLVAFAAGITPSQIMADVRKRETKSGKLVQFRTHEKIVWGSYALHTLGAEHFVTEKSDDSAMTTALRWATIGAIAVESVLSKDEDAATRAAELRTRWQQKMDDEALKRLLAQEAKKSATTFLANAKGEVESLLQMVDAGVELSTEEYSLAGSLFEMLSTIVGVKVGANA